MSNTKTIAWTPGRIAAIGIIQNQQDIRARIRPSTALNPGDKLLPNTRLKSPQGAAYAILQPDGNFVLYQTNGGPLWATGTQGHQVSSVTMQTDGNFVLVDQNGTPVWASGTQGRDGARLVVQDDGNMVLYMPNGVDVWNSETYGFSNHHKGKGLFDYIGDGVSGALDIVTSIPGVDLIAGQVQDFARTSVGKTFLRGVSSYLVPVMFTINPGLGLVASSALGAALGTTAFIAPGLLRGEAVDVAFINEAKSAAEKFGAQFEQDLPSAAKVVEDWGTANGIDFDKLANEGIDVRALIAKGIDAPTIAAIAHVPPEVAQLAIDAATRTATGDSYDEAGNVLVKGVQTVGGDVFGDSSLGTKTEHYAGNVVFGAPGITAAQALAARDAAQAQGVILEPPPSKTPPGKVSANNNLLVAGGALGIALLLFATKK